MKNPYVTKIQKLGLTVKLKKPMKFGRWAITEIIPQPWSWTIATCECGNSGKPSIQSLLDGKSKSCGCLNRELSRARMTKLMKNFWTQVKRNQKSKAMKALWKKGRA